MICKPDGTPYQVLGSIQQYDPESPMHDLFNLWDQEAIKQGGSPIYYYEVFIQPERIDPIYWEERGKIWSNDPTMLYGLYEPIPSSNLLGHFGVDSPDEQVFEFNYAAVLKAVGHPPRVGSRLFTPHKQEHWEIIQRNTGEYKLWGEIRLQLITKRWQSSLTNQDGIATQKVPDYKLNDGFLLR